MKRRTFILTTSTAVVITAIGTVELFNTYQESKRKKYPLMYPLILSSFCDEETIRKIGISYRTMAPHENSKEQLLELITKGNTINQPITIDNAELVNKLELKVEQEFKEEKLITINGWVLTQTEARQCALLSLS